MPLVRCRSGREHTVSVFREFSDGKFNRCEYAITVDVEKTVTAHTTLANDTHVVTRVAVSCLRISQLPLAS